MLTFLVAGRSIFMSTRTMQIMSPGTWIQLTLFYSHAFPQQPKPVCRRYLDDNLLAAAHTTQKRDTGAQCKLLPDRARPQGEEMCLLEKISATAYISGYV